MEDKNKTATPKPENIPYIVHEAEIARHERHVKRLVIAIVLIVLFFVLTIAGIVGVFVWYLDQYDFTSYEQDGHGVNIIGNLNGVDYDGTADTQTDQEKEVHGEGVSDP